MTDFELLSLDTVVCLSCLRNDTELCAW